MTVSRTLICGVLIAFAIDRIGAESQPQLILINTVFRHGDRTPDPIDMFPNDPHSNTTFYPEGVGQLTNNGKRRAYEFGQLLRQRYNDFLGETYTPGILSARSTDYDRTKATLQLVLAALYPPKNSQIWNNRLNWNPIPTSYVSRKQDWLMNGMDCITYRKERQKVDNLPEVISKLEEYREFMNELSQLTGKNISTADDMYHIYHLLVAEEFMNLTLPDWARDIYPKGKLYDGTILAYELFSYSKTMLKLNGGKLLHRIINNMQVSKESGARSGHKIHLYSGHENNVAPLLQTLGVFEPHVPQYSSAIVIELYQVEEQYFVKVLYYFGIPAEFETLKIPGCDALCPLEKFIDLLSDVTPSENELFCEII